MRSSARCASAMRCPFTASALSIGSTAAARSRASRAAEERCATRYEPESFSEHLAWSSHGGVYFNDLLPLPYTPQTLARVAEHIDEVQTALGRMMLLENPSTYVRLAESTIPEIDFLAEVAQRTGCGLLLDVNNVFVSAKNHGTDPRSYLDAFPLDRVKEIHLGGHDARDRRYRRRASDRRARIAGRRRGLGALRRCHRPYRADPDPDRVGQRRSRLADAARAGGRGGAIFLPARARASAAA